MRHAPLHPRHIVLVEASFFSGSTEGAHHLQWEQTCEKSWLLTGVSLVIVWLFSPRKCDLCSGPPKQIFTIGFRGPDSAISMVNPATGLCFHVLIQKWIFFVLFIASPVIPLKAPIIIGRRIILTKKIQSIY